MRFKWNRYWIPCVMTMFGLLVSPLVGQETSEEKKKSVEIKAEVVDGKVIITDGEGKVRVIELKDRGDGPVIWHQESGDIKIGEADIEFGDKHKHKSQNKFVCGSHSDGEVQEGDFTVRSKAILVGPDGEKREVLLDGIGDGEFDFHVLSSEDGEGGTFVQLSPEMVDSDILGQISALSGQGFMIGVSCEPADDAMKAQLSIEHGLVVESVVEASPSDGNIEQHDILIKVGDDDLGEIAHLIEAIQDAGKNESDIKLRLIRGGKKMKVSVTPEKREASGIGELLSPNDFKFVVDSNLEFGDGVTLESFGPGLIEVTGESGQDLQDQIEQLRTEVEQLRAKLNKK